MKTRRSLRAAANSHHSRSTKVGGFSGHLSYDVGRWLSDAEIVASRCVEAGKKTAKKEIKESQEC